MKTIPHNFITKALAILVMIVISTMIVLILSSLYLISKGHKLSYMKDVFSHIIYRFQ